MNPSNQASSRRSVLSLAVLTSVAVLGTVTAFAQEKSPVQANARKTGLDIVAPVMIGGSDAESKVFQNEVLPNVTKLLSESLGEGRKVDDSSLALDPSKLSLKTDSDVRVYFIGEGASYANSLGFNTTGSGATWGNPKLIFPNASSAISSLNPSSSSKEDEGEDDESREASSEKLAKLRNSSTPLLAGDFVDLGRFGGGTQLDFFLIADGYKGGETVYSTDQSANPDGINHVVAFAYAMPNSPYLILGFEDLYKGGDRDFNDLLFAVDIGAANVAALTATPEPATYLSLGAFLALGLWCKRRQDGNGAHTTVITTSAAV